MKHNQALDPTKNRDAVFVWWAWSLSVHLVFQVNHKTED